MLEERIKQEIANLSDLLVRYDKLSHRTKGSYRWRAEAIHQQIEILEYMLEGKSMVDEWERCYKEDFEESL